MENPKPALKSPTYWMQLAIKEAKKASLKNEVPVGAVIVQNGQLITKAHNQKETKSDPTLHAELLVIQKASRKLKKWRLTDCELYVTLEPCLMCAGALIQSRISKIYISTPDPKAGAVKSLFQVLSDHRLNHQISIDWGILQLESSELLTSFFKNLRKIKKNQTRVF